jgi:hypothetical protein
VMWLWPCYGVFGIGFSTPSCERRAWSARQIPAVFCRSDASPGPPERRGPLCTATLCAPGATCTFCNACQVDRGMADGKHPAVERKNSTTMTISVSLCFKNLRSRKLGRALTCSWFLGTKPWPPFPSSRTCCPATDGKRIRKDPNYDLPRQPTLKHFPRFHSALSAPAQRQESHGSARAVCARSAAATAPAILQVQRCSGAALQR